MSITSLSFSVRDLLVRTHSFARNTKSKAHRFWPSYWIGFWIGSATIHAHIQATLWKWKMCHQSSRTNPLQKSKQVILLQFELYHLQNIEQNEAKALEIADTILTPKRLQTLTTKLSTIVVLMCFIMVLVGQSWARASIPILPISLSFCAWVRHPNQTRYSRSFPCTKHSSYSSSYRASHPLRQALFKIAKRDFWRLWSKAKAFPMPRSDL